MRSDYFAHERQYVLRRERGLLGWGTAQDVRESVALVAEALARPEVTRGREALELGCGAGDLSLWLAEQGFAVTGVDIAPTAVAWAREKAAARGLRAIFLTDDVVRLAALPDERFDLVVDGCCLHCLVGEDRGAALRSAWRVLKPGGVLLVLTMCGEPRSEGLRRNFDASTRYQMHGETAIRYCGHPGPIREEVAAAGFSLRWSGVKRSPDDTGEDMLVILAGKDRA